MSLSSASTRSMLLSFLLVLCCAQSAFAAPITSVDGAETNPSQHRRLDDDDDDDSSPPPPPSPPPSQPLEPRVKFEVLCEDVDDDRRARRARALSTETDISEPHLQDYVDEALPPEVSDRDVVVQREPPSHKSSGRRLSEGSDPCNDWVYKVEIFTARGTSDVTEDVLDIVNGDDFVAGLNKTFIGEFSVEDVEDVLTVVPSPPTSPPPPLPPARL